jgi:NAD(P)H-dependent flavin oxidoreductase YrpB (nitropropane dioxygenase family)
VLSTPFTELLGVRVPLQQAPMGGVTSPELVAAVASAGAVGMVPAQMLSAGVLAELLDDLAGRTAGVVGVAFLLPFGAEPACVEVAAAGARLVDFFYGDPDPALVARAHAGGALASWQAGSADEARAAAAGGVASARGVAACLAAGAAAVRVGTRFLATEESGAHLDYVAALLAAEAEDAVLTDAFSVMWPPGPESHRTLRSALEAAEAFSGEVVGETRMGATTLPVPRFGVPCPNRDTTGEVAAMAHYAGQGVGATHRVVPAAQLVDELVSGAEHLLRRWG